MRIHIQLGPDPISLALPALAPEPETGAFVEFRGLVRSTEAERAIGGLVYEAYQPMAEHEITRIAKSLLADYPVQAVRILHRLGPVPVGEAAIYICITARHRTEAFSFLAGFMDQLKKDVPIWKTDTLPAA
ncbi:molybdenum cofactor biosynthesis protein MoaE [bacterium]|jgi:molybdopterin synthase catalytic subunit|nr:molybdenum cofactor biosynthesis protein MoaE [bacterium]